MKFKKRELFGVLSAPASICLITYVSVCQTTWKTSKAEHGRGMKRRPGAWAAPLALFASKNIPKYWVK
jgi:hypothetical protein